MATIQRLLRLFRINYVLMRHGLIEIILATHLYRPLLLITYLNPYNWARSKEQTRGQRIRRALEDLGPIFIKFGQILSTRRDLLPDDIAKELVYLQDRVPPFAGSKAKDIVERAFGCPIEEVFSSFEMSALASASVAQVHAATLHTGEDVVVKVLRPGINKTIKRDLSLMYAIAAMAERYWPDGHRYHPHDIVAEFEHSLMDELDLHKEAANASQLRRNFTNSTMLYVPNIYWDHTYRNVMVMERIYGVPITDIPTLTAGGTNLKILAERGVEIFFTQVFRDCFFHADMHAGNIFVDIANPEDPKYVGVDFGIMGSLGPDDQYYLAENMLAFFQRDYHRVAQLHVESGWVPAKTRVDEFESAIRGVCEPIFERPLKEISFGHLLLRLFQTARRFEMEVQPQLILLQKTLLNVEGLGRQLYPDLNLWDTAKPFLENWMQQRVSVGSFWKKFKKLSPTWVSRIPDAPDHLWRCLEQLQALPELQHKQLRAWSHLERTMAANQRRNSWSLLGCTLLLGAIIVFVVSTFESGGALWSMPWSGWALFAGGVVAFALGRNNN